MAMRNVSKLKLDELKQLCSEMNLSYDESARVTRSQLIALIRQNDNDNDGDDANAEIRSDDGDNASEVAVSDGEEADEPDEPDRSDRPDSRDTPEIVALKLRLKLAAAQRSAAAAEQEAEERKWDIEQQRIALRRSTDAGRELHGNHAVDRSENDIIRQVRGTLPMLNEGTDVQSFFANLEKCFALQNIPEALWHKILPGCLSANQKAQRVYSKIDLEHSLEYEYCKQEILASFRLNTKAYYIQFQTADRKGAENFKNFNTRLHEIYSFYMNSKSIVDFNGLIDDVIMNRFLESLPLAARNFVLARTPKTSHEAATLADLWF